VSLLGAQGTLDLDAASADVDLDDLLPESARRAYDVRPSCHELLDAGTALELHAGWAPNVTTTLGRLGGRTVGVLANNPLRLGGCLDSAVGGEGGAVRADVRRVRRAAGSCWSTCPATCPVSARSGTASYAAARSCCTRSPRPWCRG
jgi:hypothetical protein